MKSLPEIVAANTLLGDVAFELYLADQKRQQIKRKMDEIRILEIEIDHHKLRARALRKEKANGKR